MRTQEHPGLEFSETLSGGFQLGARDPERGFIAGTLARSQLSIHCTIRVADVIAFTNHPDHAARLEATVDFTPFGQGIQARPGTFHLYTSDGSGHTKLMIYRFGFDWSGSSYLFEGKKFMHDGVSFFSLWGESTRLYSYLYRTDGDQSDGDHIDPERAEIAGAGVLQISVRGVVQMLRSMHVIGARSALEMAETRARFSAFCLGEIWDSYRGEPVAHEMPARP